MHPHLRPPVIAPAPSPQEAAAIAAALERFVRDTAAPPRSEAALGGWLRAARLEAVATRPQGTAPWGACGPW
jgi:hypothetical protein